MKTSSLRWWLKLVLTLVISAGWVASSAGCEISLGGGDKDEADEDDDEEKSKKKKKKKKSKKKKKDDDEDDDEKTSKKDDDDDDKPTASPSPKTEAAAKVDAIRISELMGDESASKFLEPEKSPKLDYRRVSNAGVQIPLAQGWKGKQAGLYTLAIAPKGDALLAFTTVGSRGELTGRLVHVQKLFQVNDYKSEGRKEAKLGPDKLPALFADGSCKFGSTPGDMAWVLVDTGARRMVLVIVAGQKNASDQTRKEALSMVYNMRKDR